MTSAREIMAMVGLVSTQLLARSFGEELAGRLDASALPPGALTWVGSSATTERGSGNPHGSQDKHS
jgi:hypothetical protein